LFSINEENMKLLDTHLYESEASDSLRHLLVYISRAVKYIRHSIQMGDLGAAGTTNKSGEDQLALDVLADKIIMENIMICRLVSNAISEEQEKETICDCGGKCGEYSVCWDPLDGSSLVDANLAIGSVFSIYREQGFVGRTGRDQVAALYAVYGPRTTFVYSVGKGVHEFTLNDVGEFTLTRENMTIADTTKHFAPGNLRAAHSDEKYKGVMESWMNDEYTLRYSGGMTPDVNHMLMKGAGVFTYPAYPPKYPDGKLRLLFECNPFAYLVEQAGGKALSYSGPILDIKIKELHQRTPIFIGSSKEVERVVEMLQ
jgi:fructose-1,6-bisphosphatase I